MRRRSKLFIWIGAVILLLIILAALSDFIVKWVWMDNVGYGHVFWSIKLTQILLFICAFVAAFIYIGTNVHFLSKNLKSLHINLGQMPSGESKIVQISPNRIKTILYGVGGFISFFFALSYFFQWNTYFRFHGSQLFGVADPIFGNDISFYTFRLPFIETIQDSFIILVFIVTIFLIVFSLIAGKIHFRKSQFSPFVQIDKQSRRQIFTNIGIWLLLLAWGYFLSRYHLLYANHSLIFGAGYTQVHIVIPILWVMFIGCILLAAIAFFHIYRTKIGWFIKGALGLIAVAIIGEVLLPALIQNFKVEPNELKLEKPYIKNNIHYTRLAYHLNNVKKEKYNASDTLTYNEIRDNQATIDNIRIWDPLLIKNTYSQLQEIRLYYHFNKVQLDRYHTSHGYRQVLISPRELENELPPKAQNWINNHLQYTHGFGLVMSPSVKKNSQGNPLLYLKDIPPVSSIGMKIKQPAIYYDDNATSYKLVNTKIAELDYPKGDQNVYNHYQGKGGVAIDNFFKRLLFAWHFGDVKLLLTSYIRSGSKIQFWTSIQKRIHKIAPFLTMKDDPYMVVSGGKLYWIQDAYVTANHFPYSEPYNSDYNYIRNSVKIVVDAYQGTVQFYIANKKDPVLKVYRHIFPNMFHPLSQMPANLKQHIKYPKYLFTVQLEKFGTYHMTDPQVFYNKEDLWRRPNEKYAGQKVTMHPYYILSTLPGTDKLQYLLISPMNPENRDNMISWMVVQSDFPSYGKMKVYELPKDRLFLGPDQIEAMIDQNTKISRQLSLWNQRGSQVMRGNLMVIPIEDSFLYVEPVFLIAQGVNIPQLKRVIATTGSHIVMAPTLNQAIDSLYGVNVQKVLPKLLQKKTEVNQENVPVSAQSKQLKKLQKLWDELQTALQNKNWEKFGQKMKAINNMLKKKQ
jgi:uncharacterized membrane protein (UPF0182 family)